MTDDTKRQGGEQDKNSFLLTPDLITTHLREMLDVETYAPCRDIIEAAADTIEALQQRCKELQTRGDTLQALSNEQQDDLRRAGYRIAALEADIISRETRRKEILDFLQEETGTSWECENCGTHSYHHFNRECVECGTPFPLLNLLAFKLYASHSDTALAPGGDGGERRDFSGWLPESEAPRDGTPVILAHFDDDTLSIPVWFVMGTAWNLVDAWKGWDDYFAYPPTHYRPLIFPRPHPTEPDQPDVCDVCERPAHWTEICTNPLCPNEKVRASEPDRPEGELQPHSYVPSAQHMGDCKVCGHVQDSPIHGTPQGKEGE